MTKPRLLLLFGLLLAIGVVWRFLVWSPGEGLHAQVSLFWGGGDRREWQGELRLESAATLVPWLWLTDFENGDHYLSGDELATPAQKVPAGWRRSTSADFTRQPAEPPKNGALLATVTEGEADGLCFNLIAAPGAEIVLDFGGEAVLRATVEELFQGPIVVPVDDAGNVLLAQATDLRADAPRSGVHLGRPTQRSSLHTHSRFSTNNRPLDQVVESLRPFVRIVWWTDHNVGDDRFLLAEDFENEEVVRRFWRTGRELAQVRTSRVDPDANSGEHAFYLEAEGDAPDGGRAWIKVLRGAGQLQIPLRFDPVLRWAWKPLPDSAGAPSVAYVVVVLRSKLEVRYLSGQPAQLDPTRDIVVNAPTRGAGGWQTVERNLAADVRRLHGDVGIDAGGRAVFGVLAPSGTVAGVLFDDVEFVGPEPPEVIRLQEDLLASFDAVRSYIGLEQSAWLGPEDFGLLLPHLTALVPDRAAELFVGFDHAPTGDERRAFVRSIQAAGGCVGTHHMQVDEHYEALLDDGGLGVDLFEVGGAWWFVPAYATELERRDRDAHGYPALTEDEVYPLLVRWDRLTARGLLLSLYGAPDLHLRFDRSGYGWLNRWLTWTLAEDDTPEALLRALRGGQASATEWRSGAVLSLSVDGRPWMGKLVVTDRERHTVRAHVSGAIPGSRLRWIRGGLVRDLPGATGTEPDTIGRVGEERVVAAKHESILAVDTSRGVFVRAELLNPAGHVVALSNPVVFAPYWPSRWPGGKVAFDWRGVSIESERGLTLTDARVADDGLLVLEGFAGSRGGELTVRGAGVRELPPGPFALSFAFDPPWDPVPVSELEALPRRKELLLTVDVGDPVSEKRAWLDGFGPRFNGPLRLGELEGSYRAVGAGNASFRLPIPAGEPVWLKLRTYGFSPASGRLLMDGEEIGSFARMSAKTFEIEPARPGSGDVEEHTFTLILDPSEKGALARNPLFLKRIELWRGDGVVDY